MPSEMVPVWFTKEILVTITGDTPEKRQESMEYWADLLGHKYAAGARYFFSEGYAAKLKRNFGKEKVRFTEDGKEHAYSAVVVEDEDFTEESLPAHMRPTLVRKREAEAMVARRRESSQQDIARAAGGA